MSPELLEALHREALDRLEVADMAAAHARSLDIEEVHTAEKISSEWLGHVIGGNVDGALLENAVQKQGHDGMTDRRQWGCANFFLLFERSQCATNGLQERRWTLHG